MSRELPKDWMTAPVKELFNLGRGRVISKKDIQAHPGEYPVYSSQSKGDGAFGYIDSYDFEGEHVTWTTDGANAGTVFYRTGKFNCTNVCGTLKAKAPQNISHNYAACFLGTIAHKYVSRVGNDKLMNNVFAEIPVKLPPLPEQKKIAAILSSVDEAINATQAVIDQTRKVKEGLLQDLLTRGIGHTRFKQTEIGEIPEGWDVARGEEITTKITKGQSPRWQGFDYQDDGVLFVTSENVRDGRLDVSKPKFLPLAFNDKLAGSQLQQGDILINIVGASIGRVCIYDSTIEHANINQAVCLFRVRNNVNNSFISYFLQSNFAIGKLVGTQSETARPNLSLKDMRSFVFPLPPIKEQEAICNTLSRVDSSLKLEEAKLAQLQKTKRGLMQDLLSGDVRVAV